MDIDRQDDRPDDRRDDGEDNGTGIGACDDVDDDAEGGGFVVVNDPAGAVRTWRRACADADRVRAALEWAGLGGLFAELHGGIDATGEPVVVLRGAAGPRDVERLLRVLTHGSGRRTDGAA